MRDTAALGVGLVLLANTRPFEGVVLVAAPACFVLAALLGRRLAVRLLLPAIVLGLAGLLVMGVYNHGVTGGWWLHPYVEYERQYAERPVLSLQEDVGTKSYRHEVLRDFFHNEDAKSGGVDRGPVERGRWGLFAELCRRFERLRGFFVGRLLFLPFIVGCIACWRFRAGRLAMSGVVAAAAALLLSQYFRTHYASAVAAPLYILTAIGFERMAEVRRDRWPVGAALSTALVVCVFLSVGLKVTRVAAFYEDRGYSDFTRTRVIERLAQEPGKDLVIVRYADGHDPNREWVYNRADIDGSEVVWARDMGAVNNSALIDYLADRRIWDLHINEFEEVVGLELVRDATVGSVR